MRKMIYNIIIQPIEYILEVIFTLMYRFFGNAGWALFGVSIGVSFLTLPLYMRADAVQEKQKQKEVALKKWTEHIKKSFRGDEKFMILETYYRQQNYHQFQTIQGTFPLLLQIPFFIAAYHYLSNLTLLQGYSFGPLTDLGVEDRLIVIAGIGINVLPVFMTAINFVSTAIYTKGLPIKDKLQPYLLALVFLVLLYHSPSGLVLYWTLNNLFSLAKNFVLKFVKSPKKFLAFLACIAGNLFIIFSFINGKISYLMSVKDYETILIYGVIYLVSYLPVVKVFAKKKETVVKSLSVSEEKPVTVLIGLTVLCGLFIPMALVASAPMDFVDVYQYKSPVYFVITSLCTFGGLFLLWGGIIYWICDKDKKSVCTRIYHALFWMYVLNFFCFKADVGKLSTELIFDRYPRFERMIKFGNLLLVAALAFVIIFFWDRIRKAVTAITLLAVLSMFAISMKNYISTDRVLRDVKHEDFYDGEERVIPLSKNGRNVIVIMLDRAVGAYVPFIFDEKPELKESFDGFTFYPNTSSFAIYTNIGAPALFGGYDYMPEAIDARDTEPLAQKSDEALKLMPKLFAEEDNAKITVCDLPNAGYDHLSDFSIFDEIGNVNGFHLEGIMSNGHDASQKWEIMERNFFFYSLFRTSPTILQDDIYDDGNYLTAVPAKNLSLPDRFYNAYNAINTLQQISVVEDTGQDTLFMFDNNVTHDPAVLQLPDYTVSDSIDNSGYDLFKVREVNGVVMTPGNDGEIGIQHYHCNMAAMLILGRWFDWMKEEGVYDNTRIVIVSDHGRDIGQFPQYCLPEGLEITRVNALLMVKDFNSTGFDLDYTFMTNADTPSIAMKGIIDDPVNPFTGNPVNMDGKANGINVAMEGGGELTYGTQFEYGDAPWYHVHDDIFNLDNWTKIK